MKRHNRLRVFLLAAIVAAVLAPIAGQERERSQIPPQYQWDLTPLYASDAAWRQAKDQVAAQYPKLQQYKGKLGTSAATLLDAANALSGLNKEMGRLFVYAGLKADEDTRDSARQAMRQEMSRLASAFAADVAWFEPEILKMGREKITAFVKEKPALKIYEHAFDDVLRRQPHTGSEAEERIIADAGLMAPSPTACGC